MGTQYIRVKRDGFIYEYNELMSKNSDCEVVSAEIAYPELFLTAEVVTTVKRGQAKRKTVLNLATTDIPEAPVYNSPELAADAARGLPQ